VRWPTSFSKTRPETRPWASIARIASRQRQTRRRVGRITWPFSNSHPSTSVSSVSRSTSCTTMPAAVSVALTRSITSDVTPTTVLKERKLSA